MLYLADNDKIRTISVATAEVQTLSVIPGSLLSHVWGVDDSLYVTGGNGFVARFTAIRRIRTDL